MGEGEKRHHHPADKVISIVIINSAEYTKEMADKWVLQNRTPAPTYKYKKQIEHHPKKVEERWIFHRQIVLDATRRLRRTSKLYGT